MSRLSASTVLAGVVGFPVGHSLSPLLHNAAYRALGLDWAYAAFEVPPADFDDAVTGARALGMRGLSVTMPHKERAVEVATRRSATARRLWAANTLSFDDREIVADSTDGGGLLDDLQVEVGYDVAGRRCAVIGAGGAARAVILALAEAGASEILVVNRTAVRAFRAAALAPGVGRVARPEELEVADLVVQATPAGMADQGPAHLPGGTGAPLDTARTEPAPPEDSPRSEGPAGEPGWPAGADPSRLGAGQLVVDLVYRPAVTPFLAEAARYGATTRNGLGMLVHQAARQVRRWTGTDPPLAAMWAAVTD